MVFKVGGDGVGMVGAVVVAPMGTSLPLRLVHLGSGSAGRHHRSMTKWTASTNSAMVYSVHLRAAHPKK